MSEKTPPPKPKKEPIYETLEQAEERAKIKNLGYLISQSSSKTSEKDQPLPTDPNEG